MAKIRNNHVLPHPVWMKRGAVQPRNQKNVVTSDDRKRFYSVKAEKAGNSVVDIKNNIVAWQRYLKLFEWA
jgi:hypothetical protein